MSTSRISVDCVLPADFVMLSDSIDLD